MKNGWKVVVVLAAMAGVATWLVADHRAWGRVMAAWGQLSGPSAHAAEERPGKDWIKSPGRDRERAPAGTLQLSNEQVEAIGLKVVPVKAQDQPIILRLTGVTDYDPDTLTIISSQFDCRVDRVVAQLGSVVKKNDPLLEVFSTDLADAKNNYETARSQWIRDKKFLDY